nr:hypothetical protein [Angustibacter aerolatus]
MALAASGLVVGAAGLQASSRDAGLVPRLAVDTATVRVVATVASDPRRIARHDAAGGGRDLVLVRLRLHRVEGRGSASASRSRVLVFADPSLVGAPARPAGAGHRQAGPRPPRRRRVGDARAARAPARAARTASAGPHAAVVARRARACLRRAAAGRARPAAGTGRR